MRGCGDGRGDARLLVTAGQRAGEQILIGIGGGVRIQEVKNLFDLS